LRASFRLAPAQLSSAAAASHRHPEPSQIPQNAPTREEGATGKSPITGKKGAIGGDRP